MQQRDSLGPEFTDEAVDARQVASRPIETRNKPELDGIGADAEHDWDAGGRSLGGASGKHSCRDDHIHAVEHIHISEGGQAVIGNVRAQGTPGRDRQLYRAKDADELNAGSQIEVESESESQNRERESGGTRENPPPDR